MNELDELADLRSGISGRSPDELVRARQTLDTGIAGTGNGQSWHRPSPGVWRLWRHARPSLQIALTGATAMALAVAVAASVLTGTGSAKRSPAVLTAADVLGRAAISAVHSPQPVPRPGQYLYQTSVEEDATPSGPVVCAHPKIDCRIKASRYSLTTNGVQFWVPVSGHGYGAMRSRLVGQARLPWGPQPTPARGGTPPTVARVKSARQFQGTCLQPLPDYALLASLPTDPRALRGWIYRHMGSGAHPADQAWAVIENMLQDAAVLPKLAAALFQVAATIPGARVVPHVTDAAGRPGIAVARYDTADQTDQQIIFTTHTYQVLGDRWLLTSPEKGVGPVGTVVMSEALLKSVFTSFLPPYVVHAPSVVINARC
ncbi:MAG TPA: CU044_5270 family protein [Streptosporangiaceae bacterium]|nr:CU044_5270 family protein [Streptosporangiaceae bacterium]